MGCSSHVRFPRSPNFTTGEALSIIDRNILFGLTSDLVNTIRVTSRAERANRYASHLQTRKYRVLPRPNGQSPWEGQNFRGMALRALSTKHAPSTRKPNKAGPRRSCQSQHDRAPQPFPIVRQHHEASLWTGLSWQDRVPRISHTRGQERFFPLQAIADLEFFGWILAGWVKGRFWSWNSNLWVVGRHGQPGGLRLAI